jgi:membrane peptidoglycan carboxypeptidase
VKMGIKSLFSDNPNCCGWALTLGGMERGVRLIEETSAYGVFGTLGNTVPPVSIRRVYDRTTGKLLYDSQRDAPKPTQVLKPQYAYIMNNVLSDNASRCTPSVCEFGPDSPLNLGRPAAAKTGTTNGFTDNWTVGYTPDLVTGVWVGNADNTQMVGTTGITGAAPIWHDFMLQAFNILKLPPVPFAQPPGVDAGSTCRLPGAYASYSTMGYDIFAGIVPYCGVGLSYASALPVPQTGQSTTPYQAPATTQAPIVQQQPAVLPTAVPVQPAPVQQAPVQQAPVQQAPVQAAPTAVPVQPAATTPPAVVPGIQPSP